MVAHHRPRAAARADGTIHFIGTMTRMIKSAAENIYPPEVEACIESHPAVKEAALIGVPDPRFRQSVKAVVALEPGATATEQEIIEHCRSRIASYKKPRSVEFVDALPRKDGAKDYDALDQRVRRRRVSRWRQRLTSC